MSIFNSVNSYNEFYNFLIKLPNDHNKDKGDLFELLTCLLLFIICFINFFITSYFLPRGC